jgi:hypothetical protein
MKTIAIKPYAAWIALSAAIVVAVILWSGRGPDPGEGQATNASRLADISVSAPSPEETSMFRPELASVLSLHRQVPPQERLASIGSLGEGLSAAECEALLAALLEPRHPNADPGWHSEYFHRIALVLQKQAEVSERFARVLATVARDGSREEVVRDYALQHLRQVWARNAGDPLLRGGVESIFRELVSEPGDIAASALLSLHLLGTPAGERSGPGIDPAPPHAGYVIPDEEIEELVSGILAQRPGGRNIGGRMTAARIIGDRRLDTQRPALLAMALGSSEHSLVRLVAIHSLGVIGDSSDMAALDSFETDDRRIGHAIRSALATGTKTSR